MSLVGLIESAVFPCICHRHTHKKTKQKCISEKFRRFTRNRTEAMKSNIPPCITGASYIPPDFKRCLRDGKPNSRCWPAPKCIRAVCGLPGLSAPKPSQPNRLVLRTMPKPNRKKQREERFATNHDLTSIPKHGICILRHPKNAFGNGFSSSC